MAFDKHLKQAFPDHLAPIFIIAVPCDYERGRLFDKIASLVRIKDPHLRTVRLTSPDDSFQRLQEEILTPTLWGGETLIIYEGADKVKNLHDLLSLRFPTQVHLLLGTSNFKPLSNLYLKGKKEIIVLDLSEEKPWEKERRLQEWVVLQARLAQKNLHPDVLHYLFEHVGPDAATLDQELAKLICYVGEKPQIDLKDAEAICGTRDLFTGWQLAEKIVWECPIALSDKPSDLNFLFPFIGQLRYHLQLGYRLAEFVKNPIPDFKRYFPTLRPNQLGKFIPLAKARKPHFFQRGLQALYNLEVASKSSPLDITALFDVFQARLYAKTLSTS